MSQTTTRQLKPKETPQSLSLVFPVFNEAQTLQYLRDTLEEWRKTISQSLEIILVEDGSTDASLEYLEAWAKEDPTVRILSFSRNFGHQMAVSAGMARATGEAVVILDADLQDPLDVIPEMIRQYEAGYDIVYGKRSQRQGESAFKRASAWAFYRFMRLMIHRDMPADAGDFRLISKTCLQTINAMPEKDRFLRGLFAWTGFAQTGVSYVRQPRAHGTSKYPLLKMLRFGGNAIISFSPLPIRCISLAGALTACFGFLYGLYVVARWFFIDDTVQGWPSLIVLLCLIGGMSLLGIGIVGEYVSRIYESIKQRPNYIVQHSINFDTRK